MDQTRRNSESPGGSSWSLPDVKNPIKILSRSMTSDVLLRNVDSRHRSGSPVVNKAAATVGGFAYKEVVEKYVVKTSSYDKPRVERQLSEALIVVKSSREHDSTYAHEIGIGADRRSRSSSTTDEPDFSRASLATPSPTRTCDDSCLSTAKVFHKILESLYLGDSAAADDRSVLCKLNVHCAVRVNGDSDGKCLRDDFSCACANQGQHKTMSLKLDKCASVPQLINAFKDVNQFIYNCRSSGNKVLVFEREGVRRSGALVVQYIMHYYKMKYYEAKDFVDKASFDFDIPANLDQALKMWESEATTSSRPGTPNMEQQHMPARPEASAKFDGRKCQKQIAWE